MFTLTLRRLAQIPVVLFVIATLTFFLIRTVPGGPYDSERRLPPEVERHLIQRCDRQAPVLSQYITYLKNWSSLEVDGCTGMSLKYPDRSVREMIGEAMPVSLQLAAFAFFIAVFFGVGTGVLAAWRHNTWTDRAAMASAIAGISIPAFVLGPLLVVICSLQFGWLPPARWDGPATWILPSFTLGASYAAYISRLTRAGLLEVLGQNFITTARAKGLPPHLIILRHALRGGLLPVVSFLGPAMAFLITSSVVVEQIFAIPGLGRAFIESALNRDYNVVLGIVLVDAVMLMALNLFVDLLYGYLDPRVRIEG